MRAAVNAHGFVRPTKDIELVIQLTKENLGMALPALKQAGYRPYQHVDADGLADAEIRKQWKEYVRAKPQLVAEDCEAKVVALGTLLKMKRAAARPDDLKDIEYLEDLHGL